MGNGDWRRGGRVGLAAAAALVLATCGVGPARAESCSADSVQLRGDWGQSRFNVEIADDEAERARGLMYRDSMPASAGMLFVYDAPRPLSFWMRNTLIPLDMLFVDATGVVRHIHHNAVPLDETPISGGDDLLSVLEINGGMAKRLGIDVGTQLRHPAFSENAPAWPC